MSHLLMCDMKGSSETEVVLFKTEETITGAVIINWKWLYWMERKHLIGLLNVIISILRRQCRQRGLNGSVIVQVYWKNPVSKCN